MRAPASRRAFAAAAALLAILPAAAKPRAPARWYRIGWVRAVPMTVSDAFAGLWREALAVHGLAEGRNIDIIFPDAWNGDAARRDASIRALVQRQPDVLLVGNTDLSRAVQKATRTIPIVFYNVADPVAAGLVTSLSRPGANVTGVSVHNLTLFPKRLELIRELMPHARRVGLIVDGSFMREGFPPDFYRQMRDTAKALGLELLEEDIEHLPNGLEEGIRNAARRNADIVLPLGPWPSNRKVPFSFADAQGRHRVPVLGYIPLRGGVEDGLLIQYGVGMAELTAHGAELVALVLGGVRPRDIPVRQATTVELVINLKVARELGIAIPKDVLRRADRVVE